MLFVVYDNYKIKQFIGRDTIGQSQSGTGKTAAFLIPALQIIDQKLDQCQVLVLAPTRELAFQIHGVCEALSQYMEITCRCVVGGTSVREDIRKLTIGVEIVIGMPGRVLDMIKRGALNVKKVELLILDEADELLSRGFKDQIYGIFQFLPSNVQAALFSTTFPKDILQLTTKFMRNPAQILIEKEKLMLNSIKQYKIEVGEEKHKLKTLIDLYTRLAVNQAIIYCNTKKKLFR